MRVWNSNKHIVHVTISEHFEVLVFMIGLFPEFPPQRAALRPKVRRGGRFFRPEEICLIFSGFFRCCPRAIQQRIQPAVQWEECNIDCQARVACDIEACPPVPDLQPPRQGGSWRRLRASSRSFYGEQIRVYTCNVHDPRQTI